jgi:hypothetical protein
MKNNFQVEISNLAVSSSKIAKNASVKFMVGTFNGHGVPRIFTLSKALEEFPLETSDGVNQEKMVKEQELVLGNMSERVFPNYTKRKFTFVDYEQMVMEA